MKWDFRTRLAVCAALSLLGAAVNLLVKRDVRRRVERNMEDA